MSFFCYQYSPNLLHGCIEVQRLLVRLQDSEGGLTVLAIIILQVGKRLVYAFFHNRLEKQTSERESELLRLGFSTLLQRFFVDKIGLGINLNSRNCADHHKEERYDLVPITNQEMQKKKHPLLLISRCLEPKYCR